jgi:hypothetical protein
MPVKRALGPPKSMHVQVFLELVLFCEGGQ